MSLTRALSNAVSGLQATSRGTEVVSANMSNALTPGYGRRELTVSSQTLGGYGGGVRVTGIDRIVNESVLAEHRLATASQAEVGTRVQFNRQMESLIGTPGQPGSLGKLLGDFQNSLIDATTRPDDEVRLANVLNGATRIASRLNTIGDRIQQARTDADRQIAAHVDRLSAGLDRVAYLNRRIATMGADGTDASSLLDERQKVIDGISDIVPIQTIQREGGRLALYTSSGAVLLDGTKAVGISFTPAGEITADMTAGVGPVEWITYGDTALTAGQMRLFSGGALEAAFSVRDELAVTMQEEVDAIARDLYDRLADPAVDGTIPAGQPGLFTDDGGVANPALPGLAQRLKINTAADQSAGGEIWRIRAGMGAASPGSVGDGTILKQMSAALQTSQNMAATGSFSGQDSLRGFVSELEARAATRRVSTEEDATVRATRLSVLNAHLLDGAVDSDTEMQRLLQYEQAYAANARVIQAVDEMMAALLRI